MHKPKNESLPADSRDSRPGTIEASTYSDPAFLELEREKVFRRAWIVAGLEGLVRKPGDYFTFDQMGESIFILRDKDGELRAFHNTCRHRGTRLLDGRGCVQAIRCPYHDWKYALDGRLRHVPGAENFRAEVEKGDLGLLKVRVDEALGFIWINLDPDAPPLRDTLGDLVDELAPYKLGEMCPLHEKTEVVDCNWKALLDNATESYHLPFVHGGSVEQFVDERPNFVTYDDHYRLSLGIADYQWRRWLDARTARGGPYTDRQMQALHKYVLFPNFLMNVLPYHLTIFQVWPVDANRCRFFYGFYLRKGARGLEWLRGVGTWLASRYILLEDFRILTRFQKGAKTGHIQTHRLHQGEVAMDHFHQVLARWMQS